MKIKELDREEFDLKYVADKLQYPQYSFGRFSGVHKNGTNYIYFDYPEDNDEKTKLIIELINNCWYIGNLIVYIVKLDSETSRKIRHEVDLCTFYNSFF